MRYLLITDGPSDRVLLDIINWLIRDVDPSLFVSGQWADPREYQPSSLQLEDRLPRAMKLYDCDLIFIHRDAEKEPAINRFTEARRALDVCDIKKPAVIVVPIRMTEAWFLADERAIRRAADNPNGMMPLHLPALEALEKETNPKETLFRTLREASGLPPRRIQKFDVRQRLYRVAELTSSFEPLRTLAAFKQFEADTRKALIMLSDSQARSDP